MSGNPGEPNIKKKVPISVERSSRICGPSHNGLRNDISRNSKYRGARRDKLSDVGICWHFFAKYYIFRLTNYLIIPVFCFRAIAWFRRGSTSSPWESNTFGPMEIFLASCCKLVLSSFQMPRTLKGHRQLMLCMVEHGVLSWVELSWVLAYIG